MSSINPVDPVFALVDCNNFYVSCERVFNPKFSGKPVVVLSNNDGCVIARSKESKKLGISMGVPFFQHADQFKKQGVIFCSSNYTLYGDMSSRVMDTLRAFTPDLQVYSIDEAFLLLEKSNALEQGKLARKTVLMHTGIPVSIGIGPTKTLAKIGNHIAKSIDKHEGVFALSDPILQESILRELPVKEIWGIGGQISNFLTSQGIRTGWDLRNADDHWIKKNLTVVTLRTVWELRGISCLEIEETPPSKKSITSSRSFGRPVATLEELQEAISAYAARAAEKLRKQKRLASCVGAYIESKRTYENGYYSRSIFGVLPQATDYTPILIEQVKELLSRIYRPGMLYRKVGVFLEGLVDKTCYQPDLFYKDSFNAKHGAIVKVVDSLNKRSGKKTIRWAAEGMVQPWRMKQDYKSKRFTTCWEEILTIKC